MDSTKTLRLLIAATTLSMVVACSQPTKVVEPITHKFDVIEYVVQPGDSLTKISKILSGTHDHWEKIANFNGINDPLNLSVGELVLVPAYLVTRNQSIYTVSSMTMHLGTTLPSTSNSATAPTMTASTPTETNRAASTPVVRHQPVPEPSLTVSTPTSYPPTIKRAAIFQAESLPGSRQVNVDMKQVNVNRKFDVTTVGTDNNQPGTGISIRVVGTYYPKGIYSEPELASSLLMRVSPGSTFQYVETIGDWVKISTDTGIGYIRKIDALIMGAENTNTTIITTTL